MEQEHICGQCLHHRSLVEDVMQQMPDPQLLEQMADLLKMFGDTTRVRIMYELLDNERCVGEIAERLGMTVSSISHQLRVLKQARLVKSRRAGKTIWYSLADAHVKTIFYHALEHVME